MSTEKLSRKYRESPYVPAPTETQPPSPALNRIFYVSGHVLVVKGFLCIILIQDGSKESAETKSGVFWGKYSFVYLSRKAAMKPFNLSPS